MSGNLNMAILVGLSLTALWTVMTRSLLRSAIGLAMTSALLTVLMFRLHSPLAAVFELSVCTGLISVMFVSTISLTHPLSQKEVIQHMKERLTRFWYLPFMIVATAIILSLVKVTLELSLPGPETVEDVRHVLWNQRQIDIFGQIIILLAGVFGVAVLFREKRG